MHRVREDIRYVVPEHDVVPIGQLAGNCVRAADDRFNLDVQALIPEKASLLGDVQSRRVGDRDRADDQGVLLYRG